jgi:carboxymethylenebutenolidase
MNQQSRDQYLALPRSGTGPGVLVLHAWWGLNDFIRDFCERLAQEGFVALAPDMFSGKIARTPEEAEQLVSQSNMKNLVPTIVLAALEELDKHPAVIRKGLGVVGFSFGGNQALWLATQKPEAVRAVTIFYSTGEGDFQKSKAAFLGHFGETDPFEPEAGVQELEKNIKKANRPTKFYTYPGTGHWFFESDRLDAYNPQAAQLAWDRTTAFLHEQLDSGSGRSGPV